MKVFLKILIILSVLLFIASLQQMNEVIAFQKKINKIQNSFKVENLPIYSTNDYIKIDLIYTIDFRPDSVNLIWHGPESDTSINSKIQRWEFYDSAKCYISLINEIITPINGNYIYTDTDVDTNFHYRYRIWFKEGEINWISNIVYTVPCPEITKFVDWVSEDGIKYNDGRNDTICVAPNSISLTKFDIWKADFLRVKLEIENREFLSPWQTSENNYCIFNVSPDLKHVKVGISFMGSSTEKETGFKGIKSATGYIQHKLGKKLFLKYTPSIEFVLDERKEYRIEELLSEIRKERDERDKGKD